MTDHRPTIAVHTIADVIPEAGEPGVEGPVLLCRTHSHLAVPWTYDTEDRRGYYHGVCVLAQGYIDAGEDVPA